MEKSLPGWRKTTGEKSSPDGERRQEIREINQLQTNPFQHAKAGECEITASLQFIDHEKQLVRKQERCTTAGK